MAMKRKQDKTGTPRANNPRFQKAKEFYLRGGPGFSAGNAFRSMLAAGYARATAKSNCHLFGRDANLPTREALSRIFPGRLVAEKLLMLADAKTVKWNPAAEAFDEFEDGDLQLRAIQERNKICDDYPAPKEITGDNRPITIVFPKNFSDALTSESAGD